MPLSLRWSPKICPIIIGYSMNSECQSRLAEAKKILAEAQSLNAEGQCGAAIKLAYEASEFIAAGYLSDATGNGLPLSDATYERFAKAIRTQAYNPAVLAKVKEAVSKVSTLREIYEPTLLDETTSNDARQFIDCVTKLEVLVEEIMAL